MLASQSTLVSPTSHSLEFLCCLNSLSYCIIYTYSYNFFLLQASYCLDMNSLTFLTIWFLTIICVLVVPSLLRDLTFILAIMIFRLQYKDKRWNQLRMATISDKGCLSLFECPKSYTTQNICSCHMAQQNSLLKEKLACEMLFHNWGHGPLHSLLSPHYNFCLITVYSSLMTQSIFFIVALYASRTLKHVYIFS